MKSARHALVACHAWYGDMIGGAFRLATEFAEHLAESGFRVSYVCCSTDDGSAAAIPDQHNGVDIYRYSPPTQRLSGLQKLRYHVSQTSRVVRTVHQTFPVDVLSSHSPLQGLGSVRVLAKEGAFCNYTVHSPFDDELLSNTGNAGPSLGQRLAGRVARWVDYRNVALAHRVQTDSQYTLNNLQQKHARVLGRKGIVAPGWVELEQFRPVADRLSVRRQLGEAWDTDLPVLFTLRRLESRMGLDTLIQACRRIADDGLRFRTLIGGGGALKQTLQQMIDDANLQDSVRLLGRLPENELPAAYAAADCFVLPTRALECFGLIVLEAFACDTPVIASAVAAIPELAEQQGVEWMFEPGNVDQLTDRLKAFLSGHLKPRLSLREVAQRYNKPLVLQRWTQLLECSGVSAEASYAT